MTAATEAATEVFTRRIPLGVSRPSGPIVVAVGGATPHDALRAARVLAPCFSTRVLAVAVMDTVPAYMIGGEPVVFPMDFEASRRDAQQRELDRVVAEARAGTDQQWDAEIAVGDPAAELVRIADREGAPLIIMGIGRHKIVDRLLQRETTLRTIRLAHCPVIAVHSGFHHVPRKVAVGMDFSGASTGAAEMALRLMDGRGAMTFVHAWQPAVIIDPAFATVLASIDERYERDLTQRFDRIHVAAAIPPGVTTHDIVTKGNAADELVTHAEAMNADLIAVGRRGMGALERLIVGSVATAVIRRATCAVLVAPTPAAGPERERLESRATGMVTSTKPEEWAAMLERFTLRNRGRLTRLEVDDPDLGAQTQESGYQFTGAAYDHHDHRVALMLGGRGDYVHITRGILGAQRVSFLTDPDGSDRGLSIARDRGQTLMVFMAER